MVRGRSWVPGPPWLPLARRDAPGNCFPVPPLGGPFLPSDVFSGPTAPLGVSNVFVPQPQPAWQRLASLVHLSVFPFGTVGSEGRGLGSLVSGFPRSGIGTRKLFAGQSSVICTDEQIEGHWVTGGLTSLSQASPPAAGNRVT